MVVLLSGCQASTSLDNQSALIPERSNDSVVLMDAERPLPDISDISDIAIEDSHNELSEQELRRSIIEDYQKEKMIIDVDCESKISAAEQSSFELGVGHLMGNDNDDLKRAAEIMISDLESRLGDGSDETLQLAYELEIARLKLEFQVSGLEKELNELESMKEFEIDKADKIAAIKFECAVKNSENSHNKDRMSSLIEKGSAISSKFEKKLSKTERKLEEAQFELETLNSEAFDGLIF